MPAAVTFELVAVERLSFAAVWSLTMGGATGVLSRIRRWTGVTVTCGKFTHQSTGPVSALFDWTASHGMTRLIAILLIRYGSARAGPCC